MSATAVQVKPKRIQRKRTKGSKLPERTLCISRPGVWGNPFTVAEFGELAIPLFRNTLLGIWDPGLVADLEEKKRTRAYELYHEFQGRFRYRYPIEVLRETLCNYDFIACWCKETDECHGDTMIELAYS